MSFSREWGQAVESDTETAPTNGKRSILGELSAKKADRIFRFARKGCEPD
jgi:hypothetical protein